MNETLEELIERLESEGKSPEEIGLAINEWETENEVEAPEAEFGPQSEENQVSVDDTESILGPEFSQPEVVDTEEVEKPFDFGNVPIIEDDGRETVEVDVEVPLFTVQNGQKAGFGQVNDLYVTKTDVDTYVEQNSFFVDTNKNSRLIQSQYNRNNNPTGSGIGVPSFGAEKDSETLVEIPQDSALLDLPEVQDLIREGKIDPVSLVNPENGESYTWGEYKVIADRAIETSRENANNVTPLIQSFPGFDETPKYSEKELSDLDDNGNPNVFIKEGNDIFSAIVNESDEVKSIVSEIIRENERDVVLARQDVNKKYGINKPEDFANLTPEELKKYELEYADAGADIISSALDDSARHNEIVTSAKHTASEHVKGRILNHFQEEYTPDWLEESGLGRNLNAGYKETISAAIKFGEWGDSFKLDGLTDEQAELSGLDSNKILTLTRLVASPSGKSASSEKYQTTAGERLKVVEREIEELQGRSKGRIKSIQEFEKQLEYFPQAEFLDEDGTTFSDIINSTVRQVPNVAFSIATVGAGAFVLETGNIYWDNVNELTQKRTGEHRPSTEELMKTVESGEGNVTAGIFGAIAGTFELIGLAKVLKGFRPSSVGFSKSLLKGEFRLAGRKAIGIGKNFTKTFFNASLSESITESLQEVAAQSAGTLIQNENKFNIKNIFESGIAGFWTGGILGSGGTAVKTTTRGLSNIWSVTKPGNLGDNLQIQRSIIEAQITSGILTREAGDALIERNSRLYHASRNIPGEFNHHKRKAALDILVQRDVLQDEIKDKDNAFTKPERAIIKNFNLQLEFLANGDKSILKDITPDKAIIDYIAEREVSSQKKREEDSKTYTQKIDEIIDSSFTEDFTAKSTESHVSELNNASTPAQKLRAKVAFEHQDGDTFNQALFDEVASTLESNKDNPGFLDDYLTVADKVIYNSIPKRDGKIKLFHLAQTDKFDENRIEGSWTWIPNQAKAVSDVGGKTYLQEAYFDEKDVLPALFWPEQGTEGEFLVPSTAKPTGLKVHNLKDYSDKSIADAVNGVTAPVGAPTKQTTKVSPILDIPTPTTGTKDFETTKKEAKAKAEKLLGEVKDIPKKSKKKTPSKKAPKKKIVSTKKITPKKIKDEKSKPQESIDESKGNTAKQQYTGEERLANNKEYKDKANEIFKKQTTQEIKDLRRLTNVKELLGQNLEDNIDFKLLFSSKDILIDKMGSSKYKKLLVNTFTNSKISDEIKSKLLNELKALSSTETHKTPVDVEFEKYLKTIENPDGTVTVARVVYLAENPNTPNVGSSWSTDIELTKQWLNHTRNIGEAYIMYADINYKDEKSFILAGDHGSITQNEIIALEDNFDGKNFYWEKINRVEATMKGLDGGTVNLEYFDKYLVSESGTFPDTLTTKKTPDVPSKKKEGPTQVVQGEFTGVEFKKALKEAVEKGGTIDLTGAKVKGSTGTLSPLGKKTTAKEKNQDALDILANIQKKYKGTPVDVTGKEFYFSEVEANELARLQKQINSGEYKGRIYNEKVASISSLESLKNKGKEFTRTNAYDILIEQFRKRGYPESSAIIKELINGSKEGLALKTVVDNISKKLKLVPNESLLEPTVNIFDNVIKSLNNVADDIDGGDTIKITKALGATYNSRLNRLKTPQRKVVGNAIRAFAKVVGKTGDVVVATKAAIDLLGDKYRELESLVKEIISKLTKGQIDSISTQKDEDINIDNITAEIESLYNEIDTIDNEVDLDRALVRLSTLESIHSLDSRVGNMDLSTIIPKADITFKKAKVRKPATEKQIKEAEENTLGAFKGITGRIANNKLAFAPIDDIVDFKPFLAPFGKALESTIIKSVKLPVFLNKLGNSLPINWNKYVAERNLNEAGLRDLKAYVAFELLNSVINLQNNGGKKVVDIDRGSSKVSKDFVKVFSEKYVDALLDASVATEVKVRSWLEPQKTGTGYTGPVHPTGRQLVTKAAEGDTMGVDLDLLARQVKTKSVFNLEGILGEELTNELSELSKGNRNHVSAAITQFEKNLGALSELEYVSGEPVIKLRPEWKSIIRQAEQDAANSITSRYKKELTGVTSKVLKVAADELIKYDRVYLVVNRQTATTLKINNTALNAFAEIIDTLIEDTTAEEKVVKARQELTARTDLTEDEFQLAIRETSKKYYEAKKILESKRARNKQVEGVFKKALSIGDEEFNSIGFYDGRSRINESVLDVNLQSSLFSRAINSFAQEDQIGTTGWRSLGISTAAHYSPADIMTENELFSWFDDNLEQIINGAAKPRANVEFITKGKEWEGYLALSTEVRRILQVSQEQGVNVVNVPSGFPVELDASNSVLQIAAALTYDENTGKLVNLIPSLQKEDSYSSVGDELFGKLPTPTEGDLEFLDENTKKIDEGNARFGDETSILNFKINKIEDRISITSKKLGDFEESDSEYITFKEGIKTLLDERLELIEKKKDVKKRKQLWKDEIRPDAQKASQIFWGQTSMKEFHRDLLKGSVMTNYYNSVKSTMSSVIYNKMFGKEGFEGMQHQYTYWLADNTVQSADKIINLPGKLKSVLHRETKAKAKAAKESGDLRSGDLVSYGKETGFKQVKRYRKGVEGDHLNLRGYTGSTKNILRGKDLSQPITIQTKFFSKESDIKVGKTANASMANLIQGDGDAQTMGGMYLRATYPYKSIHDAGLTTARHVEQMKRDYLAQWVEMFDRPKNDSLLLEILTHRFGAEKAISMVEEIGQGTLDNSKSIDADYMFGYGGKIRRLSTESIGKKLGKKEKADLVKRLSNLKYMKDVGNKIQDLTYDAKTKMYIPTTTQALLGIFGLIGGIESYLNPSITEYAQADLSTAGIVVLAGGAIAISAEFIYRQLRRLAASIARAIRGKSTKEEGYNAFEDLSKYSEHIDIDAISKDFKDDPAGAREAIIKEGEAVLESLQYDALTPTDLETIREGVKSRWHGARRTTIKKAITGAIASVNKKEGKRINKEDVRKILFEEAHDTTYDKVSVEASIFFGIRNREQLLETKPKLIKIVKDYFKLKGVVKTNRETRLRKSKVTSKYQQEIADLKAKYNDSVLKKSTAEELVSLITTLEDLQIKSRAERIYNTYMSNEAIDSNANELNRMISNLEEKAGITKSDYQHFIAGQESWKNSKLAAEKDGDASFLYSSYHLQTLLHELAFDDAGLDSVNQIYRGLESGNHYFHVGQEKINAMYVNLIQSGTLDAVEVEDIKSSKKERRVLGRTAFVTESGLIVTNDNAIVIFSMLKDPENWNIISNAIGPENFQDLIEKTIGYINNDAPFTIKNTAHQLSNIFDTVVDEINGTFDQWGDLAGIAKRKYPTLAESLEGKPQEEHAAIRQRYELLDKLFEGQLPEYIPYTPTQSNLQKELGKAEDFLIKNESFNGGFHQYAGFIKASTKTANIDLSDLSSGAIVSAYSSSVVRTMAYLPMTKQLSRTFNEKNVRRLKAVKGEKFVNNLLDQLKSQITGKTDNQLKGFMKGANDLATRGIANTMNFNISSALFQSMSGTNGMVAMGSEYFTQGFDATIDAAKILNKSTELKIRGKKGATSEIFEAALEHARRNGDKGSIYNQVWSYLAEKGYTPTKTVDRLAVIVSSAPYLAAKLKEYRKSNPSWSESKIQHEALIDTEIFYKDTQQATDQMRLSDDQKDPLKRYILFYQNTNILYSQKVRRAWTGLNNGTGDKTSHVKDIVYYGALQRILFPLFKQAIFNKTIDYLVALAMGEEPEEEGIDAIYGKYGLLNTIIDSILIGRYGWRGAAAAVTKNTIRAVWEAKDNKKLTAVFEGIASASPPVSNLYRRTVGADKSYTYDGGDGVGIWNRDLRRASKGTQALTGFPIETYITRLEQLHDVFNTDLPAAVRFARLYASRYNLKDDVDFRTDMSWDEYMDNLNKVRREVDRNGPIQTIKKNTNTIRRKSSTPIKRKKIPPIRKK